MERGRAVWIYHGYRERVTSVPRQVCGENVEKDVLAALKDL